MLSLNLRQTICAWCAVFGLLGAFAPGRADVLPQALARAQAAYEHAKSNQIKAPDDPAVASELARTAFELAELSDDSRKRATLAEEGIASAKLAIEKDSDSAAGHLYLGLNLGELARTRKLSALSLLRQMERALLRALELDPQLDHAGGDRSIGQLYLEAPGWPASVGSKKKAREHLQRAVSIAPDYPDNVLSLLEAFDKWDDEPALAKTAATYTQMLPAARKKFSGPEWDQAWHDWDERWAKISARLPAQPAP